MNARRILIALSSLALVAAGGLGVAPAASAFEGSVDLNVASPSRVFPTCVAVVDGYAYVTSSTGVLAIVRVSDGSITGTLDEGSNAAGLVLSGGKLYVTAVDSNMVSVIDTSSKTVTATITNSGTTPTGGLLIPATVSTPFSLPNDIVVGTVSGHEYLFVSNISGGMTVIDPQTNLVVSKISISGQTWGIIVDGNYAYLPVRGGNLSVIDITKAVNEPVNAVLPSVTLPAGADGVNGTAANGYLYIAAQGSNSVLLVDASLAISDPGHAYVSSLDAGASPFYAAFIGGLVYVSNQGSNTLSVIDPVTRTVTSTIAPVNLRQPGCVASDHGTLYVASGQNGLLLGISSGSGPDDSASVTTAVPIPMWMQSTGRTSAADSCPDGTNPSWAMWPNGGTGGYVCDKFVIA
jgi:YVTN family beta-propeller protein